MSLILSKILPSEVIAEEVIFSKKSKVEFFYTYLKTFGPSSFIIIKNKILLL